MYWGGRLPCKRELKSADRSPLVKTRDLGANQAPDKRNAQSLCADCPQPRCGPDHTCRVKSEVVGWKIDGRSNGIWPGIALRALSDASAVKAGPGKSSRLDEPSLNSGLAIRAAQHGEPKF